MADPISIIFTGVKVGLAIHSFIEKREARRGSQTQASSSSPAQQRQDLVLVLGHLGRGLQPLGITNYGALPAAKKAFQNALQAKDASLANLFTSEMEEPLQYAIVLAAFFCAACWPMPVYRGFGAGVMNEKYWGAKDSQTSYGNWARNSHEDLLASFDGVLASLKMDVSQIDLLKSYPQELSQISEIYGSSYGRNIHGCDKKKAESWLKDLFTEGRKRGPPQPTDGSFTATEVVIIHTDNSWINVWSNVWDCDKDTLYTIARYHADPGKRFYAYLVDGQLELPPGRLLLSIDKIDYVIVKWLSECESSIVRLVPDAALDDKHSKFKKKNRWVCWFDKPSVNVVAVRDEAKVQAREKARSEPITKRPAPPPPKAAPVTRKVEAQYDFTAQAANEMSFKMGDLMEVLKEADGDGWLAVRRNGVTGDVPESYVRSIQAVPRK